MNRTFIKTRYALGNSLIIVYILFCGAILFCTKEFIFFRSHSTIDKNCSTILNSFWYFNHQNRNWWKNNAFAPLRLRRSHWDLFEVPGPPGVPHWGLSWVTKSQLHPEHRNTSPSLQRHSETHKSIEKLNDVSEELYFLNNKCPCELMKKPVKSRK